MSNPWEKEKKSYQSTIEKLVARKADIYAHLGAAIAYQAKDDPAVLLPYPIQAAALNDIEQKTEAFRKRMAQAESIIQHEEIPWTKICSCGAYCPQSAGFCCVCGAPIHRGDTNKTADDVSSLKSAGNRALTGLQSLPAIPATRAAMESSRHFAYESAIHILASESNICYSPRITRDGVADRDARRRREHTRPIAKSVGMHSTQRAGPRFHLPIDSRQA